MRRATLAWVIGLVVVVVTACSTQVHGSGTSGLPPLASDASLSVVDDAHTDFDRLAKNALTDVITYWQKAYPSISGGKALPALQGKIYSVDDIDLSAAASNEACIDGDPRNIQDNAFYCRLDDSIAYDRVGFLPQLAKTYGPYFVALVFAHEFGHAVQQRLGISASESSIVRETQADCAAGAFTASVLNFSAAHFRIGSAELDKVLVGYIQLRDPTSHSADDKGTHGDGFDRLSALADGINHGATYCYSADWSKRSFTERPFTSDSDYASGGNEPLAQVLDPSPPPTGGGLQPDLNVYWKQAADTINKDWSDVKIAEATHPPCATNSASEFGYCPDTNTVYYSDDIAKKAYQYGDYALGTLFVYGWGLAVQHQLFGRDLSTSSALLGSSCLAGAYSENVNVAGGGRSFALSPPDMDEATVAVLTMVGNDLVFGERGTTGLERIGSFTKGYFGGLGAC